MQQSPDSPEDGTLKPLTEREALDMMADDHAVSAQHHHYSAAEERIRASLAPDNRVTWVRISDLLSSGAGRIAGRGIDFEADLARRLRHPVDATRRAIRDRRALLPPPDAFGRSRPQDTRNTLGRS